MNISSLLQSLGGEYAFYDCPTGGKATLIQNAERFSSASIIKVPLLLAWVHLERAGAVNRTELCCLDDEPQIQGAGFSWLLRARQLPYQDVLLMMIALSDNLCTNLVIKRMGLETIEQVFRDEFHFQATAVQRKLMDYAARARGLDNWISVQDCIHFYDLIDQLEPDDHEWVESMLAVNQDDLLLRRNIPPDEITFYHKTGCIPGVLHDWGYTRERRIFLLTQKLPDQAAALPVFGTLGERLWQRES